MHTYRVHYSLPACAMCEPSGVVEVQATCESEAQTAAIRILFSHYDPKEVVFGRDITMLLVERRLIFS